MADHVYEKSDVIRRLEAQKGKTLGAIDNRGIFAHVRQFPLQKGVAGTVVEQCIFEYSPDSKQEADLIILEGGQATKTELKTTGMLIETEPKKHYVAKEPMSITAVGVYDIAEQEFYTSHFWEKLEHMLIVYYHYASAEKVSAYAYKDFPLVGYEFHEFAEEDVEVLKNDWEYVRKLCEEVVKQFPGPKTSPWKANVRQAYIDAHGQLRKVLSYIDLAPKFPPRFRLKRPAVSAMIYNHFGFSLEQIPGRYTAISDIDKKCRELTAMYGGRTIGSLAQEFSLPNAQKDNKAIAERIVVSMFGGSSPKLNQIALFEKFGLIAKSITLSSTGGRTEDMKLTRVNFNEIVQTSITEENGTVRAFQFEDSDFYAYFADHELLCIMFEEPEPKTVETAPGVFKKVQRKLSENIFLGFKRLVFSDVFIEETVKALWADTRGKVLHKTLRDVGQHNKDGSIVRNGNGNVRSAPNFMKSKDNAVFLRGSGKDSSSESKTECVNGIKMLPQYVWLKGASVVSELNALPYL